MLNSQMSLEGIRTKWLLLYLFVCFSYGSNQDFQADIKEVEADTTILKPYSSTQEKKRTR